MITGANNPGMAEEAQTASQTLPDFKITFSPELISVAIIASGNLESSIRESPIYSHSKSFRLWLSNKPYFESLNDDTFDRFNDLANRPISSSSISNA